MSHVLPTTATPAKLRYTTAKEDLQKLLHELGYDAKQFGEHSGKRGGATAAAASGATAAEIKLLGRWRSDATPHLYVDASVPKQLRLSQYLQINN